MLALGPWSADQVQTTWLAQKFEPAGEIDRAADAAVAELRERGSPSHDGLSARLAGYESGPDRLSLELQPSRWSLRLVDDTADSLSVLCVARAADGRWLAGRRAAWLASWAGRWALGAGGSVEVGENPAHTLTRELAEEWSVSAERLDVVALARLPSTLVILVGVAWLPAGAEVVPDAEHDEFAWWPADVDRWPEEADEPLRRMATMLAAR
ncbi:MAG: NUDIX hydrolase [Solirubrobacterales bacterium]|nr:MAG: NUDIX hydrolase [Solirubrobacterales bacterium]